MDRLCKRTWIEIEWVYTAFCSSRYGNGFSLFPPLLLKVKLRQVRPLKWGLTARTRSLVALFFRFVERAFLASLGFWGVRGALAPEHKVAWLAFCVYASHRQTAKFSNTHRKKSTFRYSLSYKTSILYNVGSFTVHNRMINFFQSHQGLMNCFITHAPKITKPVPKIISEIEKVPPPIAERLMIGLVNHK